MGLGDDPYVAYCFDEAAYAWGLHVQNELNSAGENAKDKKGKAAAKQRKLMALLGEKNAPGQFRDPAEAVM